MEIIFAKIMLEENNAGEDEGLGKFRFLLDWEDRDALAVTRLHNPAGHPQSRATQTNRKCQGKKPIE